MLIGNILIQRALDEDKLRIRYSEDVSDKSIQIGTNSIDVTLAKDIYLTKPLYRTTIESDGSAYTMEGIPSIIDPRKPVPEHLYRPHVITDRGYMLEPGECILASAQQAFDCTDCNWVQHYEGRSTMARIFIMSHVTAGFGDYGFNGAFTLEIKNLGHHSVVLYPGMRIGQVYFEKVTAISHTYEGYTQTDFKPQLPRLGDGEILMKNVSMIVAYLASSHLSNYYIGTDKGNLPWASFPEDMDRFRTYTMGKVVIMGRKTYESIGKPLEGRINIVITSQPIKGVLTCTNVLTAIQHAHSLGKHVVIIGGAQLYDAAIEYVDEIKLTIADMPLRTYGNPVCLTPRTVAFMHNKFKPTSPIKIAKRTIDGKLVPTIFRTLVRKNINQSGKVGN